jgi:uncharacterized phiE125 gp8 family phage protein
MHAIALAGPAVEPIPLAEMRGYLRLDSDAEDALVAGLIAAARLAIEGTTRLALIAQTWRLHLDACPADGVVILPLAPVLSVESVRLMPRLGLALSIGSDELTDWSTSGDRGHEQALTIVVWAAAGSAASGLRAADRIATLLEDAPLALAGHRLVNLTMTATETGRDDKTGLAHATLRLRAVTEVAA